MFSRHIKEWTVTCESTAFKCPLDVVGVGFRFFFLILKTKTWDPLSVKKLLSSAGYIICLNGFVQRTVAIIFHSPDNWLISHHIPINKS